MIDESLEEESLSKFRYKTFGPFTFTKSKGLSSQSDGDKFWSEIDGHFSGLRSAIGIYIFSIRATKRSKLLPWYVGRTQASFEKRFHDHKKLFSKLSKKNGSASVFLLARLNDNAPGFMGRLAQSPANDVLETMLIERCLDVNPKLLNASKVKHVKGLLVPGFKGKSKGKPTESAKQLKSMLSK